MDGLLKNEYRCKRCEAVIVRENPYLLLCEACLDESKRKFPEGESFSDEELSDFFKNRRV